MIQNISKVPKGGANINIGLDKIMGRQPLNNHARVIPILTYFNSIGIHHLDQISLWDNQSTLWSGWTFPAIPVHLMASLQALQYHLHDITLIKKNEPDGFRWDLSGSKYTIQFSHQYICNSHYPMTTWNHW